MYCPIRISSTPSENLELLFEIIIKHIKISKLIKFNEPLQTQISSLNYDSFIGKIRIGRLFQDIILKDKK